MPQWLISFLMAELAKYLTPELVARLEKAAEKALCCRLKAVCDAMADGPAKDALESAVRLVADAAGVDLSTCAI